MGARRRRRARVHSLWVRFGKVGGAPPCAAFIRCVRCCRDRGSRREHLCNHGCSLYGWHDARISVRPRVGTAFSVTVVGAASGGPSLSGWRGRAPVCVARSDEVMGCARACTLVRARTHTHTHTHTHTRMRVHTQSTHTHSHTHMLAQRRTHTRCKLGPQTWSA